MDKGAYDAIPKNLFEKKQSTIWFSFFLSTLPLIEGKHMFPT